MFRVRGPCCCVCRTFLVSKWQSFWCELKIILIYCRSRNIFTNENSSFCANNCVINGFGFRSVSTLFPFKIFRSENWFFVSPIYWLMVPRVRSKLQRYNFVCCLRVECRINKIVSNMNGMPVANRAIECGRYIFCINNCVRRSDGIRFSLRWHRAAVVATLARPVSIHFTSMDLMCSVNALTRNLFAHKYWAKDALFPCCSPSPSDDRNSRKSE